MAKNFALATKIISSLQQSRLYYIAAELGLADLLAAGPKHVDELATLTESDPTALFRVLRALVSIGCFTASPENDHIFSNNEISEVLKTDQFRYGVLIESGHVHYKVYEKMMHSVKTGKPATTEALGAPIFDYFRKPEGKESGELFHKWMGQNTNSVASIAVSAYDWGRFETVCDVGGSDGTLITAVLQANSKVKGVLFDLPQVASHTEAQLKANEGKKAVVERLKFVGGSFFEADSIPTNSDVYVMKHIIHDWDDEQSGKILKNIHLAMKQTPEKKQKLLLIEFLLGDGEANQFAKLLDVVMLVMAGGKERTKEEFSSLLEANNFKLANLIPLGPFALIEAEPVF